MEQVKRMRLIHRQQQLEHLPELIQRIQLKLPSKDAARTCILSKSWLHAWSTSPAIRFCPSVDSLKRQHQRKYMRWIHLTLLRYHRDNLPVTSLDLHLGIHTIYRAARKLIMQATSKNSLKELHLAILALSFTLPDEIFSSEHLHTLRLQLISPHEKNRILHISNNPAIRCTNLRVLQLSHVNISEDVFNELISKNKLLEKIILNVTPSLNEIKISNLRYLREFIVCLSTHGWINYLEFDDVPSLRSLVYNGSTMMWDIPPTVYQMCTIQSLRELELDNMFMDDAFSNMIKSNFPFLEKLILSIKWCSVEILDITCLTLLELAIYLSLDEEIKVQVHAPNLLTYKHTTCCAAPSLLFTTTPPEQIDLNFALGPSVDGSLLFLKMREALKLPSKFNIEIFSSRFRVFDDVKTIVPYPATNVEEVVLSEQSTSSSFWENSLLLDALFSTCHPMYVKTNNQLRLEVGNYFLKLIEKGVIENCEIRNSLDGRWVALTSSSLSLLDTTTARDLCEFKPSWCSVFTTI